ncbi:GNAT family N-acetyltransferase [Corynebacterium auriscanis]|uniref:GNAT family N-acetyltransferase n=1 Tax=Corynebacterium auriscanis TaxID=99807 RepID=UPI002246A99E|nr:GNAT family protein [Corynebacterium auriscanis]MCX2162319.1 GNAT family N-acetyltransferase [Corynebacterium auriscanis]
MNFLSFLTGASTGRLGWPVDTPTVITRSGRRVHLRSLERGDGVAWRRYRIADRRLLEPVEPTATSGWEQAHNTQGWKYTYRNLMQWADRGAVVPMAIEVDGRFAGQLTLGNIQHGAIKSCWIGYWVYSGVQGQGVATAAVALGVDHAFRNVDMHRIEATVMEENIASRKVLEKAGFRHEGTLLRNLHINGEWTDHLLVAVTMEEIAAHGTLVRKLLNDGVLIGVA